MVNFNRMVRQHMRLLQKNFSDRLISLRTQVEFLPRSLGLILTNAICTSSQPLEAALRTDLVNFKSAINSKIIILY